MPFVFKKKREAIVPKVKNNKQMPQVPPFVEHISMAILPNVEDYFVKPSWKMDCECFSIDMGKKCGLGGVSTDSYYKG